MTCITETAFDVNILDLILDHASALAVADYAQLKLPDSSVIIVTDTTFFSDGSIFSLNTFDREMVSKSPQVLAAMVSRYGRAA